MQSLKPTHPLPFLFLLQVLLLLLPPAINAVCPNDCNDRGRCEGYTCICEPPYTGDDCSHTPSGGDSFALPLTSGHKNITSTKQLKKVLKKYKKVLIGFSAPSQTCHVCASYEVAYQKVHDYITDKYESVIFIRVNGHEHPKILQAMTSAPDPPPLPCLFWKDGQSASFNFYDDFHSPESISRFIDKQMSKPLTKLTSTASVDEFISTAIQNNHISLIGFFTDPAMQDDEIEDFENYAKGVQSNSRVYAGIVEDEEVRRSCKDEAKTTRCRRPSLPSPGILH